MRLIGFELEMRGSESVTIDALNNITMEHSNIRTISGEESANEWNIKSEHCGREFTSPAIEATRQNMDKIYNVVEGIRSLIRGQHIINRQCGFHVHVDIRDLNVASLRRLVQIFAYFEPVLLSLQPSSRRNNHFVAPINGFLSEAGRTSFAPTNQMRSHYMALNFGRYTENGRKTCEIRYGAGTIRGRKVINWIETLVIMIERSKHGWTVPTAAPTLQSFKEFIMETDTGCWLNSRKHNLCCWLTRRDEQIQHPRRRARAHAGAR